MNKGISLLFLKVKSTSQLLASTEKSYEPLVAPSSLLFLLHVSQNPAIIFSSFFSFVWSHGEQSQWAPSLQTQCLQNSCFPVVHHMWYTLTSCNMFLGFPGLSLVYTFNFFGKRWRAAILISVLGHSQRHIEPSASWPFFEDCIIGELSQWQQHLHDKEPLCHVKS